MLDYLDWSSEITTEDVFASNDAYSYPTLLADGSGRLLYVAMLKEEQSRSALMLFDGERHHCLTPAPFNLRTRVNEYGGKPYWIHGQEIIFSHSDDQCLYQIRLPKGDGWDTSVPSAPERISPQHTQHPYMYTDVHRIENGDLLAIVEQATSDNGADNSMFIGLIHSPESPVTVLVDGADFYSNLIVNPSQKQIAWVQWCHPAMPWDETELWIANLDKGQDLAIAGCSRVPLEPSASVCQLMYASDGRLFFSADYALSEWPKNYWNVHVWDPRKKTVKSVTREAIEFGYPHWQYGDHRIVQADPHTLVTIGSTPESDLLFAIDLHDLRVHALDGDKGTIQHLSADGDGVLAAMLLKPDARPKLVRISLDRTHFEADVLLDDGAELPSVSNATHVEYSTRDGGSAYAFYYDPSNEACEKHTDRDALPPLIVMVHGGPTARAYGHFDIQKQFWTSRGFAILDVNHRGSSGYGRRYRDALYGEWGELDTSDIVDAIRWLIDQRLVDPQRVCIRGKSAGGYAVLRALTEYPEVFRAGACYYGIGNLATLAEVTHKFEKFYTDRLIGEAYAARSEDTSVSRYYRRSPVHKLHQLQSAMIVFQGALDKVVPPDVAKETVAELQRAGLWHEYVEYAEEGHGFRQLANCVDALDRELAFYRAVLK
ncbi:peptidase [Arenicella chitinivorans]|uniref:Peptidase n=1 Tax=Arenicella chitinivorans TaxID=1329800 RepID=A0A918VKF4_9GAMM|nr:prolyl oligopeptidase family serine peptidase [Arenicella chitinivorans]GHA08629.1 peptidase [Arenicella chitinivorans]